MADNTILQEHVQREEQRLARIEDKIDKLSDAMIDLARAEEKLINIEKANSQHFERMNRFSMRMDDIEDTVQEQGKTVILSSHQLSEIEMIANRMVIINKGETLIEGSVSELLNTSQMVVRFQLDDVQRGMKLLKSDFQIEAALDALGQELELEIEKMRIADVAECFIKNGLRIYSIEQKRKLEDYFIKMIQEG